MTTKTIALKTILNDIIKDNPKSTLTTKAMRVKLRAKMKASHEHNATWEFTQAQYVSVRSMFDPAFAKRNEKPARVKKVPAVKTPVEV